MKKLDDQNPEIRQYDALMHVTGFDRNGNQVDPADKGTVNLAYGMSFIGIPVNPVLNFSADNTREEQRITEMLAYARESAEFYLNYLAESGLEIPAPVAHVSVPRDQEVGLVGVFKVPVEIPKAIRK